MSVFISIIFVLERKGLFSKQVSKKQVDLIKIFDDVENANYPT